MNSVIDLHNSRIQNICLTVGLFVASDSGTSVTLSSRQKTHNHKTLWIIPIIAKTIYLNIYRIYTQQRNKFSISCLFEECLSLGLSGYFSSNCWLGTQRAGLLSHLHQDWQCFPHKHVRQPTQRGPSLCKHVQTCKHRPSSAIYAASVSEGGETLKSNLSICSRW